MKKYDNMKAVAFENSAIHKNINDGTEQAEIIVKIGEIIYRFQEGDPEWEDWKSVPSYDDPDLVYALMLGCYVAEYKKLIPYEIKNIIKEETVPSSDWSKEFNEAYKIYKNICDTLDSRASEKEGAREDAIFEKFYDLLYNVVSVFYKATFYDRLQEFSFEIEQCQEKYDEFLRMMHNYKKALETFESDTPSPCDIEVWKSVDKLINIFNKLIEAFYERTLEYGAYFREYDMQYHKKLS